MPEETFFDQTHCDRCHGDLRVRKMSWFNQETICLNCSNWEDEIINHHPESKSQLEAIGYIPDVPIEVNWTEDAPDRL